MIDYYDNPALSQSKLKDLKKSPKHFWAKHLDPNREREEPTAAMELGTAIHMCFFEFPKFNETYVVSPKFDKRTKEGKQQYSIFSAQHAGKTIIEEDVYRDVLQMRDALWNKKTIRDIVQNGEAEKEFFWKDETTRLDLKAKMDYVVAPCERFENGLIIDLKTTLSADTQEFSKTVYNYGYHNQAAFYSEAYKQHYGTHIDPLFVFIALEKTNPFESKIYSASSDIVLMGGIENNQLLALYAKCIEDNNWSGYSDEIEEIRLPKWVDNNFIF